ncbi:MAG: polyprenol monophosphomannose synthase [Dehalococcoidia bacterium]|nr:polyprenol monophosphomannose synthase [Dehalococcoidia bacterium]
MPQPSVSAMSLSGKRVTIVIPTYNEAGNIPALVQRLMALGIPGLHLLLVDDSSPDGTADVAERLAPQYGGRIAVLRRPGKMGLGTAYIAGFTRALAEGADYIVEMDADLSHSPEDVPRLLAEMATHDVAVGSRWVKGGGVGKDWGLLRRFVSRGGSQYARLVLGLRVKDVTTGFKCFRRESLAGVDLSRIKSQGFAFQVEVAWACQRRGYRMAEIPILFSKRSHGTSKMSVRIFREALWRVPAIRLRR